MVDLGVLGWRGRVDLRGRVQLDSQDFIPVVSQWKSLRTCYKANKTAITVTCKSAVSQIMQLSSLFLCIGRCQCAILSSYIFLQISGSN